MGQLIAFFGADLAVARGSSGEVIVIPGGNTRFRIRNRRQAAVVVILIGNHIVIFVGTWGQENRPLVPSNLPRYSLPGQENRPLVPADFSGIFLKPLRAWDYPNKLPFVPQRRCLLV